MDMLITNTEAESQLSGLTELMEALKAKVVTAILAKVNDLQKDTIYCPKVQPLHPYGNNLGKHRLLAVYCYDCKGDDTGTITVSLDWGAVAVEKLHVQELVDLLGMWERGELIEEIAVLNAN